MKSLVLAGLVACSSPQRADDPPAAHRVPSDAGFVDATSDAAPRDAIVTTLIPPDAASPGRVVVTTSDPCGLVMDIIYFSEGSSELTPQQQPVADATGEMLTCMLKESDGAITKLEVQGHADAKEKNPLQLSEERAVRVANMLIKHGVPASILRPVGYGNAFPIDKRKTAAARAKNRRVMFLILERKVE